MPYTPPSLDFSGSKTPAGSPLFGGIYGSYGSSQTPAGADPGGPYGPAPVKTFQEILSSDPFYLAQLANLKAQGIYDKTSRDAAIRTAMIRFGYAPDQVMSMAFPEPVLGQPGHVHPSTMSTIVDAQTRSLAEQNTTAGLSIWARIQDAAKQQQKRAVDVLGSRGLFRSGETGYQLQRGSLAADQARYDAINQLTDFLTGAQAAYVQSEMQRQALLLQAQQDAADRAGEGTTVPPGTTPPGTHPPPTTTTPPPSGSGTVPHTTHPVPTTNPPVTDSPVLGAPIPYKPPLTQVRRTGGTAGSGYMPM